MNPSQSITRLFFTSFIIVILISSCTSPAPDRAPTATSRPETPTATPLPYVYLADLTPVSATVGFGSLGVGVYDLPDSNFNGKPIHAHGNDYPHGLMAHAPSRIEYRLDGKYRLFRTQILRQDEMQCGDGVVFKVLLDGQEVYSGAVRYASDPPQTVELDVAGAQALLLVVDPKQGNDCDWSIWGDPRLVPIGSVAANYPTGTPIPTATLNPDLPCGGMMPEKVYLFLDCSDIRRIRKAKQSGNSNFMQAWDELITYAENYRANFPTTYNPGVNYPALWSGTGNDIARDMALIYLVTGDAAYARDELRLLDLVVTNTQRIGGLMSPTRFGVIVYQSLLFGYFAIRDTTFVSAEQRQRYDQFFIHQAGLLEQEATSLGNNIPLASWVNRNTPFAANVAALTFANAFPDDASMQSLIGRVRPRLEWQLANWWEQDGGWGENTYYYGLRSLEGVLTYAEVLYKNQGKNIFETGYGGVSIHTMCLHFLNVVTPEGDAPQVNDTEFLFADPGILLLCAHRTNDASLLFAARSYLWGHQHAYNQGSIYWYTPFETVAWWDPAIETAIAPEETSVLLPSTGLAIFRSDWSHEAQYGLLKYTASAVHTHYSFGEFFLYDHGPWLMGNGYHLGPEYDGSVNTTSTSTLTLDNARQTTIGGELLAYTRLGGTGLMAVTSPSYTDFTHTRTVLWDQTWHQWIIVDDAIMNGSPVGHSLQVRWYVRGNAANQPANGNWTFTRPDYPGILSIQMSSILTAKFSPISRGYTDDQEGNANGVEMIVAPQAQLTRLVSVLTYSASQQTSYPTLSRDDSGQGLLVTTQPAADSPLWNWLLPEPGQSETASGGYTMSGAAGCAWKQAGTLSGYCLYAGTSLDQGGTALVRSDQGISVEADLAGGRISVDAPVDSSLTLYWPTAVTSVSVNGSALAFTMAGSQLSITIPVGQHTLLINP
jgi:hypothetical protein